MKNIRTEIDIDMKELLNKIHPSEISKAVVFTSMSAGGCMLGAGVFTGIGFCIAGPAGGAIGYQIGIAVGVTSGVVGGAKLGKIIDKHKNTKSSSVINKGKVHIDHKTSDDKGGE